MKPARSWSLVCGLHGVISMGLWWAREGTQDMLTWHAEHGLQQPWTLWTSAWVHANTTHLIGNLLALAALAAFAGIAQPRLHGTLAWLLAWPLTQLSLLLWPQIGYAVGLSGLLHAGVAVLACQLLMRQVDVPKAHLWGGFLGLGLLVKLLMEHGWNAPVVWDPDNGMSVVQAAHLTGACWGLVLSAVLNPLARRWPLRAATAPPTGGV